MKKVVLLFVIAAILFFFWINDSNAWSFGKIEKKGRDYVVIILDFETESGRLLISRLTITPVLEPIMKNFFEVEKMEELTGIDRNAIKKEPPGFIRQLDELIEKIKEKYYKNAKNKIA